MASKVRKRNPLLESASEQTIAAVGLGIGVASVATALGTLYRRPSISIGGAVLGFGLMAAHLPWSDLRKVREEGA